MPTECHGQCPPNGSGKRSWWESRGKRPFDLVVVILSVPLWIPLFILLFVAVLISSGSPVIFKQVRIGYASRPFTLYKFRTMVDSIRAPQEARFQAWTYQDDPRVTRFGRMLRRSRLDELPQLLNVLRGEMSLIGPRPETPEVVEGLSKLFADYHLRHSVKPGLTGRCQVSPQYEKFSTQEQIRDKLDIDLDYVTNPSFREDMRILGLTARVLLRRRGVA